MPAGSCDKRGPRKNNVFHQAESERLFALQRWSGTASGQRDDLPGPKRRNHPLNHIALGMAVAHDSALAVDLISVRLDDFARNRNIRIRQADAVKLDLQIPFSDKVPRLLS